MHTAHAQGATVFMALFHSSDTCLPVMKTVAPSKASRMDRPPGVTRGAVVLSSGGRPTSGRKPSSGSECAARTASPMAPLLWRPCRRAHCAFDPRSNPSRKAYEVRWTLLWCDAMTTRRPSCDTYARCACSSSWSAPTQTWRAQPPAHATRAHTQITATSSSSSSGVGTEARGSVRAALATSLCGLW